MNMLLFTLLHPSPPKSCHLQMTLLRIEEEEEKGLTLDI